MGHQLGAQGYASDYVDRRRGYRFDDETRIVAGGAIFTANAGGTTTTLVGADATLATGVNVVRVGEEFVLTTSAGVLKENTVFRVTSVASAAGTTTVTFTPAAATATASTNQARPVGLSNTYSNAEMDRRLVQLGYPASRVATMTENDKLLQIRTLDDPGSL